MVIYPFALGAGYNLPLGSLTYVENISDPNSKKLYPPQSYGSYLPGASAFRLNGPEYERGYPTLEWNWTGNGGQGYLTYGGARVLRTNFFGGLWSGSLTIYTKTTNETAYELYNAIGTIRKFPDSAPNFKIFTRAGIRFTRLVAL